jgi:hypothetical protein
MLGTRRRERALQELLGSRGVSIWGIIMVCLLFQAWRCIVAVARW